MRTCRPPPQLALHARQAPQLPTVQVTSFFTYTVMHEDQPAVGKKFDPSRLLNPDDGLMVFSKLPRWHEPVREFALMWNQR